MTLGLLSALVLLMLPMGLPVALPASAVAAAAAGGSRGDGLNVIYMAQAGYQPEQFQQMTREFVSRYRIEVAANIVRYDEEYQKIVTSATSTVATYDVVLVDLIWIAEFAEKNYLVPLGKPLLSQLDLDVSPAIKRAFEYKGRVWAMPFLANIHFLFYVWTSLQVNPQLRQRDPSLALKAEQMNWLHHRPKLARYHEVSAILQRSIHSALEGNVLPQQALDTAAERIRSLL